MFERQIDDTISFLKTRAIGANQDITFRQIASSDMPESVKRFYEIQADHWVAEEKERLLASPHFRYTDDWILEKFDEIIGHCRDHAIFTEEEFSKTMDRAVRLLFNYVCRPQYTLTSFIFANADNVTIETLLNSMSYFTDYEYYSVIIGAYFERKRLESINRERFEELVALIDNEVIRSFDSHKMAAMTQPIFDLFNLDGEKEYARIPMEALSIFFDDKNISPIVERLDEEKKIRPDISMHELTMLISEVDYSIGVDISDLVSRHIHAPFAPPVPHEEEGIFAEEIQLPEDTMLESLPESVLADDRDVFDEDFDLDIEDEIARSGEQLTPEYEGITTEEKLTPEADEIVLPSDLYVAEEEIIDESGKMVGSLPSVSIFPERFDEENHFFDELQETLSDEKEIPVPEEVEEELLIEELPDFPELESLEGESDTIPEISEEIQIEEEQEFIIEEAPVEEGKISPPVEEVVAMYGDLRTMIPSNDRKKYIKKIFKRNEEAFEKSIEILNGKSSWREASEHIDEIFLTNEVDMYSRIAVKFTDEVYKRYLQKNS